ncbi:MAG: TIGR03435 family protein, partial [Bryobacteraceae bacterium]
TSAEHPVLALVVGKGGPKLKASAEKPVAIDESAPLKPGELKMDGPDGPVRVMVVVTTGSSIIDIGLQGKMSYRLNPATQTFHIDFSMMTMSGFADMITQLFAQLGGTGGRQVVDMTGIKGNYDATVELSLLELIAMARAAGADIPVGAPGGAGGRANAPAVASDPSGGSSSLADAVQSMGLKLESRKATVDQLVVDHIEKTPTEN